MSSFVNPDAGFPQNFSNLLGVISSSLFMSYIDYVYSVEKNFPLELSTGIKLEIASATSIGRSDSMMSTP